MYGQDPCGWTVVRFLPQGFANYFAEEYLDGTEFTGGPYETTNAWSLQYDNVAFDQFLFTVGDYDPTNQWLILNKDQILPYEKLGLPAGTTYSTEILSSTGFPQVSRFSNMFISSYFLFVQNTFGTQTFVYCTEAHDTCRSLSNTMLTWGGLQLLIRKNQYTADGAPLDP